MGMPPKPLTSATPSGAPQLRPILEDQGTPNFPSTGLRDRWGNGTDVETIDFYRVQSADTTANGSAIEGQILADFPSSGNLGPANFSWNSELDEAIHSVESVTQNIRFNEVTTHDATVDLTVTETGVGSAYFNGSIIGRASSPESAAGFGGQYSAHLVVNGVTPMFSGTPEIAAGSRRGSNLGHEFGHNLGLSHPHLERDRVGGSFVGNPNDAASSNANFAPGFELNNNKYSAMSYQWATDTGPDSTGAIVNANDFGQNVGFMALDIAALQHKYGIGDHNTGDTTYNMVDGAQIGVGSNNPVPEVARAFGDGMTSGGPMAAMSAAVKEAGVQQAAGFGTDKMVGRAYRTIYDGKAGTDAAGNAVVADAGDDTISYDGSQQSAFINLNDAGLGADQTDAKFLDLQREIKGSDRWDELNVQTTNSAGVVSVTDASFQNDIDATVNDTAGTLRSDAYSAGGSFSRLYSTDANGQVTGIQDGGYSIANGVTIENARGGDASDTIIGNEHNNQLDGGKGADVLYGGHGNDKLNGEEGNDTLVAGRGFNTLDGGADIDTASYRDYYAPVPGPIAVPTGGLNFRIDGTETFVLKDGMSVAMPTMPMIVIPELDTVRNVENFEGTARNDTFSVSNVSGNMYIDGVGGVNTLTVSGAAAGYTLDTTDGTYPAAHPRAGESYHGKMTSPDGKNIIYYDNIDETNISGFAPVPVPAPVSAPVPGTRAELSLSEAGAMLQAALPEARADMAARAAARSLTEGEVGYAELLNSADIPVVMNTLNNAGVKSLNVTGKSLDTAHDQIGSITEAAVSEMKARDIPYPKAEIDTAHAFRDAELSVSNTVAGQNQEHARAADEDMSAAYI